MLDILAEIYFLSDFLRDVFRIISKKLYKILPKSVKQNMCAQIFKYIINIYVKKKDKLLVKKKDKRLVKKKEKRLVKKKEKRLFVSYKYNE